ncbi:MAG: alpha/beta hydrolase [Acidimicrobiales bacterium]|nr:alpha/beta hydrolase [Acidimicrobiales bacterium]
MEAVDVDGIRVAYERVGDGPPVVLVHGYVGDGPTTWRRQLDALSDEFTMVAWDAPGAGGSSDPPEAFGMVGYADCLAGFIDALGLADPHLVGLSSGGALALELNRRHPAVPKTLVLASAYAGWAGSLSAEATEQRLQQAIRLSDLPPEDIIATLMPTMFSPGTAATDVDAFGAALRALHPVGFRAMARASAEDLSDALPLVAVPTLLVYGDGDVRAPLPVAEHLHAEIAGSALVVLPGVGHVCNIEAADAFNEAVRAFLHEHRA